MSSNDWFVLDTTDSMTCVMRNLHKVGLRAVIQSLAAEDSWPVEIHRRVQAAYGDRLLSETRAY